MRPIEIFLWIITNIVLNRMGIHRINEFEWLR